MTRCRAIVVTLVALLALGASVASASAAGPGGAAPGVLTLPDGSPLVVRLGNPLVRASGDGIALAVRSTALLHGRIRIAGTAPPSAGTVSIERRDDAGGGWVAIASATVGADGGFAVLWRPDRTGPLRLRAIAGSAAAGTAIEDPALDAGAPHLDLAVYRPGIASWYGPTPGHTGTACGVPLTRWTLGVAHRTLPCGTPVAFYYRGRSVVVPVIDRGPFGKGRTWDLTRATVLALAGDDGLAAGLLRVGALPPAPAAAPARDAR
jgi:rare lipoprotein A